MRESRNRNPHVHPQAVMVKNISPTAFPSLLHGNKTIIMKLFYFILQRNYLKAVPHCGKTWHQEQLVSLTSPFFWLLFNSNARKLTPRCHCATLTEVGSFALWEPRGGEKNIFKRKRKIIVCWIVSLWSAHIKPVLKFPFPGRRCIQGSGTLPFHPRHHFLHMVLMPFPSHAQTSISHIHGFPSRKRPWGWRIVPAPLHQGCCGTGRCQGACCGKRSSPGFQRPGEPWAVKGGKSGRVKMGRPNLRGLHLASLLMRNGREETVREMDRNPCCFLAYYYMRVRDNSVLFDRKSPSSTLSFRFFETQPEWNLPE